MKTAIVSVAVTATVLSAPLWAAEKMPDHEHLETVNVITFQGGWNLPVWVAQEKGFFRDNGLSVQLDYTPNSPKLVKDLMAGRYNIAIAGIDNVIAYQEGQGPVKLDNPDMFAFYGVDNGLLSLVATPKIDSVKDLKGKKVSVDALTTGYAFVIRNYLQQNAVSDNDVNYSSVGSTNDRFNALLAGTTDATLLRTPLNLQAKAKGMKVLASGNELGDYQGTVGVTTRSWADNHHETLVNYLRGYSAAMQWLYKPENRQEAQAILTAKAPGMTAELAGPALEELLHNGLQRDAALNPKGIRNVMELRSRLAEPKKALRDETKYFDARYWEDALGR
ncbi:MAG: ABC transporter substrate-binding protein [Sutterellaceae bacterium]|nr:ABC transporter substrate-binding protein [Sutterellaceae bacterium]